MGRNMNAALVMVCCLLGCYVDKVRLLQLPTATTNGVVECYGSADTCMVVMERTCKTMATSYAVDGIGAGTSPVVISSEAMLTRSNRVHWTVSFNCLAEPKTVSH